ncbi:MAG TPA: transposase [Rubrivivax sp.]
MARLLRLVISGLPHHVIQRGHDRGPLVNDDEDRRMWQASLREAAAQHGVEVQAWALLDDRFHLVATPLAANALSHMMQALGRRFVGWFNRRHARSGTLWDGRFRAAALEPERWVLPCMRHVELQPVHAGLAADAGGFAWSSAAHHLGALVDPLVSDPPAYWALGNTPFERCAVYRRFLDAGGSAGELEAIDAATRRGWPLGSPAYFEGFSPASPAALAPRPRGRPRKQLLTDTHSSGDDV